MNKPKLVVIEGTTCSGKTTLARDLVRNIPNSFYMKMVPSETERGQYIKKVSDRASPLEIDLLYLEDLYASVQEAEDKLLKGKTVIIDRYLPSLLSFCHRYREQDDYRRLVEQIDTNKIKVPDHLFILCADPEVKMLRLAKKEDTTRFDEISLNDTKLEEYLITEAYKYNDYIKLDTSLLSPKQTVKFVLEHYLNGLK